MALTDDLAFVGGMLDTYAESYWRFQGAIDNPSDRGVPPDMQAGPVNGDGEVEWRVLPSTLTETDVAAVEEEFGVSFPPIFRAYLLARFHLFDQVKSRRHHQLIMMPALPSGRRLRDLRQLIRVWQPLIGAGFVPFAEWGDGWGPMCFDASRRNSDGECPVVWMDHEVLIPLGPALSQRTAVLPWVQPLYASCREFLTDVFGQADAAG